MEYGRVANSAHDGREIARPLVAQDQACSIMVLAHRCFRNTASIGREDQC